jgi:hypothetical protein
LVFGADWDWAMPATNNKSEIGSHFSFMFSPVQLN